MLPPLTVIPPRTRDEIAAGLRRLHEATVIRWTALPDEAFFAPSGTAWSPADTIRHLTKSARPVARALRLPRVALLALFGRARGESRDYETLRDTYHRALAAGGQAGRFAPSPLAPPADPRASRQRIMDAHAAAMADLLEAMAGWPDRALDRYRLPHPLLGKLTLREMLCFTLYHTLHHALIVERRTGGQVASD